MKNYEKDVTVEVHCVEKNEDGLAFENGKKQFYGETMSVECLGFVRPEMKFNGLDELVTRIKTDVGLSKTKTDGRTSSMPMLTRFRSPPERP